MDLTALLGTTPLPSVPAATTPAAAAENPQFAQSLGEAGERLDAGQAVDLGTAVNLSTAVDISTTVTPALPALAETFANNNVQQLPEALPATQAPLQPAPVPRLPAQPAQAQALEADDEASPAEPLAIEIPGAEEQPATVDEGEDPLQHIRERMHLIDTAGTSTTDNAAGQAVLAGLPVVVSPPMAAQVRPQAADEVADTPRSTKLPGPLTASKSTTEPTQQLGTPAPPVADSLAAATQPVQPAGSAPSRTETPIQATDSDQGDAAVTLFASVPAAVTNTAAPSEPATRSLGAAIGTEQWNSGLNQQVLGLHQRGERQVELQLHPADLGPLSINLTLDGNTTQAQFACTHASVRTAVEQAIPQLREALASQGITLGQASVSDQPSQQPQGEQAWRNPQANTPRGSTSTDDTPANTPQPIARLLSSRVDVYT